MQYTVAFVSLQEEAAPAQDQCNSLASRGWSLVSTVGGTQRGDSQGAWLLFRATAA